MPRMKKDEIWSVPNMISYFRILLAVFFLICCQTGFGNSPVFLGGLLVLSGISDVLDGAIARKYNMVTEWGKIMDPMADKMILCLIGRYPKACILLAIFLVKECLVTAVGLEAVRVQGRNEGAKWYGKLSTAVFYVTAVLLVLFPGMDARLAGSLMGMCAAGLFLALAGYLGQFYKIFQP